MKRLHFVHTPPRHPVDRTVESDCVRLGVEGIITVQLVHAATGLIKRELVMHNHITDAGLDSLGGSRSWGYWSSANNPYAAVGTGSTAPTDADTTLEAEVSPASTNRTQSNGGFSNTSGYVSGPPDYWWVKRTWVFSETQANGNLTEIGIFDANTSGVMFMRQLLKDSGGTPTTIVKTSADQLRVIYEMRLYPPPSDVNDTVTISGTSYDMVWRGLGVDKSSYWGRLTNFFLDNPWAIVKETQTLSVRTGEGPSGTTVQRSSMNFASYSAGNFYRDCTAIWEPGVANFGGGIGSATFMTAFNGDQCFQVNFDPVFAKDNTKRLTLIVRVSWDRV